MNGKFKIGELDKRLKDEDVEYALEFLFKIKNEQGNIVDKLIDKYLKKKEAEDKEKARFSEMCAYERRACKEGFRFIAGTDEVGRGPLAGPVVAAAVILPENVFIEYLNDSKKLTPKRRELLYDEIKDKALSVGIGIVSEKIIDKINILNATKLAMEQAVSQLKPQPDILLIDALKLEKLEMCQVPIIKGDAKSISIAAASVIAKVTRDRMLDELDSTYPQYGFIENKGYGTEQHINAIKKYGICPIHRVSFTKNFTL